MWLTLLLAVAMSGVASAQATGRIANNGTGLVMGVSATSEGAQLITNQRNDHATQRWSIAPTGRGWFKLVNVGTGLCVGVTGGSTADGAAIVQWHDDGSLNQQWRWRNGGNGWYLLVNRGSGKVIGVSGGSAAPGTPLIQWHVDGAPTQLWRLRP
jgi:ABC-type uncharacterized transport system permease subunit